MAANPYEQFITAPAPAENPYAQFVTAPSGGGIPGPRRAWSDVPSEALANVGTSAQKFFGGVVEAVTSPLQTAKGVLDIGAGALQNVLPKNVVNFVNQFDAHPEAAQHAVKVANAVGGMYKERYGSIEGLKNTLATDPVGAAADISTLFSGGATATAKVAPGVSKILNTAATVTNPMAPVVAGVAKAGAPVASAIGKTVEGLKGELPTQKAARIAREAAGPALEDIRAAALNAPSNLTAAQAISGVTERAPVMQALASDVEATLAGSQKFFPKKQAEIRGRVETLKAVTPDEAAAIAAREEAKNVGYGRAFASDIQRQDELARQAEQASMLAGTTGHIAIERVSPELAALKGNPVIDAAAKEAKVLAATKGIPMADPMQSLEGLHYMKLAIDNQFKNRSASTALQNYSDAALNTTKQKLLSAIEGTANQPGISPLYGLARQQYAAMSEPVNQAQVLNQMAAVLQKPGGGERVQPFLNVLGQGENALLKRANQNPRFGGLEEVLTPEQMGAATKVAGEMTRDTQMALQANAGQKALTEILNRNSQSAKKYIPNFIDAKAAIARETTSLLEGKVNEKTIRILTDAFENGQNLSTLLNKIPFKERNEVLRAVGDAQSRLSPAKLTALGVSANALAPYKVELNNMATGRP